MRRTVRGHIIIVQEQRFRLLTERGQGVLLTLSHHANVGVGALQRYRDAQALVTVEYEGEPNMASGIAHAVHPQRPTLKNS